MKPLFWTSPYNARFPRQFLETLSEICVLVFSIDMRTREPVLQQALEKSIEGVCPSPRIYRQPY